MKILDDIETVDGELGVYVRGLDMLAIADLHLGYEEALERQGISLPLSSYPRIRKAIERMKKKTGASRLLINGDLKHEFGEASEQEWTETKALLKYLKERFEETFVVRGNHDNYLIPILDSEGVELHDPTYLEDGHLFLHGHEETTDIYGRGVHTVILAHEHPAISFREEFGVKRKFKAILAGETVLGKTLVLPVLSPLMSGNVLNGPDRRPLSPVLSKGLLEELEPIVVDKEAGVFKFPKLSKISNL